MDLWKRHTGENSAKRSMPPAESMPAWVTGLSTLLTVIRGVSDTKQGDIHGQKVQLIEKMCREKQGCEISPFFPEFKDSITRNRSHSFG